MTQKVISTGGYPVEVLTPEDVTDDKKVTSEDITDATAYSAPNRSLIPM